MTLGKVKKKSGKPFKSGLKINTIKGEVMNTQCPLLKAAYTFYEDDSVVNQELCEVVEDPTPKEKASNVMKYVGFPDVLADIGLAVPFEMLNYNSIYIRVSADFGLQVLDPTAGRDTFRFNSDGFHVPIVDLATGYIFWMAAIKPCRIVEKK